MRPAKQPCGIAQLTKPQIDVLSRVAQFKSSKQIARELGISHHTVDQRIRTIIDRLGVESRADAAREFTIARENRNLDGQTMCESLAYQAPDVEVQSHLMDEHSSPGEWNPAGDRQETLLKEAQALYFAGASDKRKNLSLASVLLKADRQNDLTAWERTVCVILVMLFALLIAGALVGLAEGLSRLV